MTPRLLALRRLSVVGLLVWTAVFVGSFLERRFRHQTQTELVDVEAPAKQGQEQPVRLHKGFVYSDTLGIEPNFRIAAREAVEFSNGWYEFRNVQVSMYHQGRVAYGLVSDTLRFDPVRHEAETGGEAEVSLQGGVALRAGAFTLGGPERRIQSRGPVTFAGPGWGGLAGGAVCSMGSNTLELLGGVSVSWRGEGASAEPSLILLAPTLSYDRNQAVIRFNDGLTVLRGKLRARTSRAELQLSGPESELRKATLEAPVRLDGILDDGSYVTALAGNSVIESIPNGRYRLAVDAAPGTGWVSARWADNSGQWRESASWWLVGEGSRSAWDWLEGQGLNCTTDIARGEEPRTVTADRMRLSFEGGQATKAVASGTVHVETGEQWADGNELELSLRSKVFSLQPSEGKRVVLGGPEGSCRCDRLEGSEGGLVTARGQVTGSLQREGETSQRSAPILFASESAASADGGNRLNLQGDARLWQGDRVVRADRLDFDRQRDVVTGEGNVFTSARTAPGRGAPETVEVRARRLRYDRGAGVATYEGDVRLEDTQAQATCQSLQASLDGSGNIQVAELDGGVTINDRTSARVITGQKARLLVGESLFEIWGSPVLVKEADGNQIKADHLQWHRLGNTVVVLGAEDNPSETLYHSHRVVPTPAARRRP